MILEWILGSELYGTGQGEEMCEEERGGGGEGGLKYKQQIPPEEVLLGLMNKCFSVHYVKCGVEHSSPTLGNKMMDL